MRHHLHRRLDTLVDKQSRFCVYDLLILYSLALALSLRTFYGVVPGQSRETYAHALDTCAYPLSYLYCYSREYSYAHTINTNNFLLDIRTMRSVLHPQSSSRWASFRTASQTRSFQHQPLGHVAAMV